MSMRGVRRSVVEVLGTERVNPSGMAGRGHYQHKVKLDCGHIVKACAQNRYRLDTLPVVAFCRHPTCVMADVEAA
jgi:hypothetical protein